MQNDMTGVNDAQLCQLPGNAVNLPVGRGHHDRVRVADGRGPVVAANRTRQAVCRSLTSREQRDRRASA